MTIFKQNKAIILASTSFIRKKILTEAGFDFAALAPDYDEEEAKKHLHHLSIKDRALELACGKALSISKKFPDAYVIGSDQICELSGEQISKSKNADEAISHLKKLSNKVHIQNNAVAIAFNGKVIFTNYSKAKLWMRNLSENEIKTYVAKEKPWGCAGSYQYESSGKHLFKKVSGDYFGILGLAIQPVIAFFYKKNIISIN